MLQQWPFRHFKQPGLYTMTFLQQPYTLQVSADYQFSTPLICPSLLAAMGYKGASFVAATVGYPGLNY